MTTVAGCGPIGLNGGSSIDSDNPSEASIFTPVGVAVDGANNILVSTDTEHRVRIILVNGSVRTLAGSGPSSDLSEATAGDFADNVSLRQARFHRPHYFVIDRQGNVILADHINNRVRMLCAGLPLATSPSLVAVKTFTKNPSATILSSVPSMSAAPSATTRTASSNISASASNILHLLYVVSVRPLRSRVESAMNCGLCAMQVVMAALCVAIASGADSLGGLLMSVLGVVAVVQNASFFAQAAILAGCAWVSESRKRHALTCDGASVGDAMVPEADHHALLAAPDPLMAPPLVSAA